MFPVDARTPVLVLMLAAAVGCRNDAPSGQVEKPQAPSMQASFDAFTAPTAVLDAAAIAAVASAVAAPSASVDALALDTRVIDAARVALAQVQQQASSAVPTLIPQALTGADLAVSSQALTLSGEGYLVVSRICDGWGAVPVADFANGLIQLTVGFTEQGVDPVVWGTLSACKYRVGEHTIGIDGLSPDPQRGDVRVYIGRDVTLQSFGTFPDPLLVELEAQVFVDGVELAGQLTFEIDVATRALSLLVPLVTGHVIVSLDAARSAVAQVRAANGTFACDLSALRCTAPDGSQIGAQ